MKFRAAVGPDVMSIHIYTDIVGRNNRKVVTLYCPECKLIVPIPIMTYNTPNFAFTDYNTPMYQEYFRRFCGIGIMQAAEHMSASHFYRDYALELIDSNRFNRVDCN